ncbi:hypothetical protein [Xanthobacter autotrophicus]|uniref:hypothetical protein n=1 Tax=Xanthobacter autotrophicus TaxID=280 RepID=UPI00372742FE
MSPPRKSGPSAEEKLERISNLQSDIYAAVNAVGVVWDLLAGIFEGRIDGEKPETVGGMEHCHIIDPGKLERLFYAVSDSMDKAEKLKDDLIAGLGYGT